MTRGCSFHFILPQICYNTISYSHAISCYFNMFHWFWSQPKSMDTLGHQCRALGAEPVPWNQRWRGRALQRPCDRRSAARCRCAGNDTAESAHSQIWVYLSVSKRNFCWTSVIKRFLLFAPLKNLSFLDKSCQMTHLTELRNGWSSAHSCYLDQRHTA